jgi:DNA-binding CsgD family transcriptional regulator
MVSKLPQKLIKKIREEVKKGKSKLQLSREFDISYKAVLKYTEDIKSKRGISQDLRRNIRDEVKSGRSKRQVAIQFKITEKTVCYHTRDICLRPFKNLRVHDRKLELMKDLLRDGYALASDKYHTPEYNEMKRHFPSICKVKMYDRIIFYLEDKKDVATRAFLDSSKRKIISFQELKRVTKTFDSNLNIKEKRQIIEDNCSKKLFQKKKSNDDSLAFFLHSEVLL